MKPTFKVFQKLKSTGLIWKVGLYMGIVVSVKGTKWGITCKDQYSSFGVIASVPNLCGHPVLVWSLS